MIVAIAALAPLPAQVGARTRLRDIETDEVKLETNIKYGPHRRNVFDLYRVKSDKPRPTVIYFHGGSFRSGDKSNLIAWFSKTADALLKKGITLVSANYRFLPSGELEGVLEDCARVVQFLRHKSDSFGIDPDRMAAFGVSAGAGISLWLAARDDRRDPKNADPVLRQSSRLRAAALLSGQFTYDLRKWDATIGKPPLLIAQYFKAEIARLRRRTGGLDTPEARSIMTEVDLINWLSKDDPPLFLYTSTRRPNVDAKTYDHYMHHPRHMLALAKRCAKLGVVTELAYAHDLPSAGSPKTQERVVEFLAKNLTKPPAAKRESIRR